MAEIGLPLRNRAGSRLNSDILRGLDSSTSMSVNATPTLNPCQFWDGDAKILFHVFQSEEAPLVIHNRLLGTFRVGGSQIIVLDMKFDHRINFN